MPIPRHAKAYRDFKGEYAHLHVQRVAAYREFSTEVQSGHFPEQRHIVDMAEVDYDLFLERLETLEASRKGPNSRPRISTSE